MYRLYGYDQNRFEVSPFAPINYPSLPSIHQYHLLSLSFCIKQWPPWHYSFSWWAPSLLLPKTKRLFLPLFLLMKHLIPYTPLHPQTVIVSPSSPFIYLPTHPPIHPPTQQPSHPPYHHHHRRRHRSSTPASAPTPIKPLAHLRSLKNLQNTPPQNPTADPPTPLHPPTQPPTHPLHHHPHHHPPAPAPIE